MTTPARPPRRPEARIETVGRLVERVMDGAIRIPPFQRPLVWKSSQVADFLDSLYRGLPVGSLVFLQKPAEAARVEIGPLTIDAPQQNDAWWVVDGQQRLTSLAASLHHSLPLPTEPRDEDPYALYFDTTGESFEPPPSSGEIPSTWIPVPSLFHPRELTEWISHSDLKEVAGTLQKLHDDGREIRDYEIPIYLFDTQEDDFVEAAFVRLNRGGTLPAWANVYDAIFDSGPPSSLAESLERAGMGSLDDILMNDLEPEAAPVLSRVLSFLRTEAGIPHLDLLPETHLFPVLFRFFEVHPALSPRSRRLLARWFWRVVQGGGGRDEQALQRRGIEAIHDDSEEEDAVQALLALVDTERMEPFVIPSRFDPQSDQTRVGLLALADRQPVDLETERPLVIARLLEQEGEHAFRRILLQEDGTIADRLFQRRGVDVLDVLRKHADSGNDRVLESHCLDSEAGTALLDGDEETFLTHRAELIRATAQRWIDRKTEPLHTDRPSIDYLLREGGVEL